MLLPTLTDDAFSPHAWGWSATTQQEPKPQRVLPTRVGMVRDTAQTGRYRCCSPHTRGDGPIMWLSSGVMAPFSPHAWGWSVLTVVASVPSVVLPTRVGMVR